MPPYQSTPSFYHLLDSLDDADDDDREAARQAVIQVFREAGPLQKCLLACFDKIGLVEELEAIKAIWQPKQLSPKRLKLYRDRLRKLRTRVNVQLQGSGCFIKRKGECLCMSNEIDAREFENSDFQTALRQLRDRVTEAKVKPIAYETFAAEAKAAGYTSTADLDQLRRDLAKTYRMDDGTGDKPDEVDEMPKPAGDDDVPNDKKPLSLRVCEAFIREHLADGVCQPTMLLQNAWSRCRGRQKTWRNTCDKVGVNFFRRGGRIWMKLPEPP